MNRLLLQIRCVTNVANGSALMGYRQGRRRRWAVATRCRHTSPHPASLRDAVPLPAKRGEGEKAKGARRRPCRLLHGAVRSTAGVTAATGTTTAARAAGT